LDPFNFQTVLATGAVIWRIVIQMNIRSSRFAAGIVDTGGKFATGINNASKKGGKICRQYR
jgi:hypothetical protein